MEEARTIFLSQPKSIMNEKIDEFLETLRTKLEKNTSAGKNKLAFMQHQCCQLELTAPK